jgi:hypothetical protein
VPHHFPLELSDFFDELCAALENGDIHRLEVIGFRGCAKSTLASLALVLWAALEHPEKYPFIVMLADTRSHGARRHRLPARDAFAGRARGRAGRSPRGHHLLRRSALRRRQSPVAISTKKNADFTAIVIGEVTWPNGNLEIYIQPHPIICCMTFSETMEALDNVRKSNAMSGEFFVEAVAYQQAAIEEMERRAFSVQAMHPIKDKRARLREAARYIKMGVVKFPRTGCDQLLAQLLGSGVEKHHDAADALVYLILGLVGDGIEEQKVHYL